MYPGIAFLIESVNWRNTFLIEAIIVSGIMLPLIILIVRYHPREKGLVADGTSGEGATLPVRGPEAPWIIDKSWAAVDWTLSKAIKTPRFWLLCLSTFCLWGITQHIMVTHHIAFAMDIGYSGRSTVDHWKLDGSIPSNKNYGKRTINKDFIISTILEYSDNGNIVDSLKSYICDKNAGMKIEVINNYDLYCKKKENGNLCC